MQQVKAYDSTKAQEQKISPNTSECDENKIILENNYYYKAAEYLHLCFLLARVKWLSCQLHQNFDPWWLYFDHHCKEKSNERSFIDKHRHFAFMNKTINLFILNVKLSYVWEQINKF